MTRSMYYRSTLRVLIVAALAGMVLAGTGVSATAGHGGNTSKRPATVRIADGENGLIVFVNKSRADLCTPERIAFEVAFLEWLDGGAQGDPPAEPPSSQQGVRLVRFTERTSHGVTVSTVDGPDLPVEVWREEDNPDGIDCTGTDGPGAALFARGTMTWRSLVVQTPSSTTSELSLQGRVNGVDGRTYQYLIIYRSRVRDGSDPTFSSVIRLVPVR